MASCVLCTVLLISLIQSVLSLSDCKYESAKACEGACKKPNVCYPGLRVCSPWFPCRQSYCCRKPDEDPYAAGLPNCWFETGKWGDACKKGCEKTTEKKCVRYDIGYHDSGMNINCCVHCYKDRDTCEKNCTEPREACRRNAWFPSSERSESCCIPRKH